MTDIKVMVLVGSSSRSWEDAVQQVVQKASQSVKNITNVDVVHQSARVESDQIVEFRVTVHVSFDREVVKNSVHD